MSRYWPPGLTLQLGQQALWFAGWPGLSFVALAVPEAIQREGSGSCSPLPSTTMTYYTDSTPTMLCFQP